MLFVMLFQCFDCFYILIIYEIPNDGTNYYFQNICSTDTFLFKD